MSDDFDIEDIVSRGLGVALEYILNTIGGMSDEEARESIRADAVAIKSKADEIRRRLAARRPPEE